MTPDCTIMHQIKSLWHFLKPLNLYADMEYVKKIVQTTFDGQHFAQEKSQKLRQNLFCFKTCTLRGEIIDGTYTINKCDKLYLFIHLLNTNEFTILGNANLVEYKFIVFIS